MHCGVDKQYTKRHKISNGTDLSIAENFLAEAQTGVLMGEVVTA